MAPNRSRSRNGGTRQDEDEVRKKEAIKRFTTLSTTKMKEVGKGQAMVGSLDRLKAEVARAVEDLPMEASPRNEQAFKETGTQPQNVIIGIEIQLEIPNRQQELTITGEEMKMDRGARAASEVRTNTKSPEKGVGGVPVSLLETIGDGMEVDTSDKGESGGKKTALVPEKRTECATGVGGITCLAAGEGEDSPPRSGRQTLPATVGIDLN